MDLIQRIRFDIGFSLAAVLSLRSGDTNTGLEEFSKACLFGVRCLEILELKRFPVGYDEIYKLSNQVVSQPKYLGTIESAYSLRNDAKSVEMDTIFENISLLNFIEQRIIAAFDANGDQILA